MKKLTFTLSLIVLAFNSCENKSNDVSKDKKKTFETKAPTNQYTILYAGSYIVLINKTMPQQETEGYALKQDGTATWLWVENDGQNRAVVKDKKNGTWEAEKDKVSISISGKSGSVTEAWIYKNGTFINKDYPQRSLLSQ